VITTLTGSIRSRDAAAAAAVDVEVSVCARTGVDTAEGVSDFGITMATPSSISESELFVVVVVVVEAGVPGLLSSAVESVLIFLAEVSSSVVLMLLFSLMWRGVAFFLFKSTARCFSMACSIVQRGMTRISLNRIKHSYI